MGRNPLKEKHLNRKNQGKKMQITNVERLNSIAKLKKEGFEGVDKSIEISLFEYGLAWKILEESNEILFVYKVSNGNFDRCTISFDIEIEKEFDWVDWESFLSTMGLTKEEFAGFPLERQIRELFSFYGHENIFGASYWEGFEIKAE